jgi:hypothetical protein
MKGICDLGPKVTLSDISSGARPSALRSQAIGRQRRSPLPSRVRFGAGRNCPKIPDWLFFNLS